MGRSRFDLGHDNLRAFQNPLGHTKIEATSRNPGVDVEDALMLVECIDI